MPHLLRGKVTLKARSTGNHRTMNPTALAGVLFSVTASENHKDLPLNLAKRLNDCPLAEQEQVALLLVQVLKNIPNDYAYGILIEFMQNLLTGDTRNSIQLTIGDKRANWLLAAELALSHPDLLKKVVKDGDDLFHQIIIIAGRAQLSTDDGWAVHTGQFVEKFSDCLLDVIVDTNVSPEMEVHEIQRHALAYLRFYTTLLMIDPQGEGFGGTEIKLLYVLLLFLGLANRDLASEAAHVLQLFCPVLGKIGTVLIKEMIYHRLQDLTSAELKNGHEIYSIWLQWVSMGKSGNGPSQSMLHEDKYWEMLQHGLLHGFSAQRKICMQILTLSIDFLEDSFETQHFLWDHDKRNGSLQAWKKYATIFEIIVFDTSANQLKDALPEFRRLLTPPSFIHGSWVAVLMALALKNSSTAVQSTTYGMIVSLDDSQLGFLAQTDTSFLIDFFLPYAIIASHYHITGEHGEICEHGTGLANFIARLLKNSTDRATLKLVDSLLCHLDERGDTIYAPGRLYLLSGIVDGLEGRYILETPQLETIVSIAGMRRFSKLRTDLAVTLCLTLLRSAKLSNSNCSIVSYLKYAIDVIKGCEAILGRREVESLAGCILAQGISLHNFVLSLDLSATLDTRLPDTSDQLFHNLNTVNEHFSKQIVLIACLSTVQLSLQNSWIEEVLGGWTLSAYSYMFQFGDPSIDDLISQPTISGKLHRILRQFIIEIHLRSASLDLTRGKRHGETICHILEGLCNQPGRIAKIGLEKDLASTFFRKLLVGMFNLQKGLEFSNLDPDAQRDRACALTICGYAARILHEYLGEKVPLALDETLKMISGYHRPQLVGDSHVNAENIKALSRALGANFSILSILIQQADDHLDDIFQSVIECISSHMRYMGNDALPFILNCLKVASSKSTTLFPEDFTQLLMNLWDISENVRIGGTPSREIYTAMFNLVYDPKILRQCVQFHGNTSIDRIIELSQEALKLSIGRRSVAPALARAIHHNMFIDTDGPLYTDTRFLPVFTGIINITPLKEVDYLQEPSLCKLFHRVTGNVVDYYARYNGDREIIAQALIYDALSKLNQKSSHHIEFARRLHQRIFGPWTNVKKQTPTFTREKKTSQLQTLLLLQLTIDVPALDGSDWAVTWLLTWEKIMDILQVETHPRFRFIFEWMVALHIRRYPNAANMIFKKLQAGEKFNPRYHASLIRILMMVHPQVSRRDLANAIVPLISNSKVAVRHLAISSVLALAHIFEQDDVPDEEYGPGSLFSSIVKTIQKSPFYLDADPSERAQFQTVFDPLDNYTLLGIFSGSYLLGGTDNIERITHSDWLLVDPNREQVRWIPLGSQDTADNAGKVEYTRSAEREIMEAYNTITVNGVPLQTKAGTWATDPVASANNRVRKKQQGTGDADKDMLICASLIQNPTNLGGLSRVSETFGCSSLAIGNLQAVSTRDFTSASVSSEYWLPIIEVKVLEMKVFIRRKKVEGYTIVGIEQTDASLVLGKENIGGKGTWKLPKKAVLLLGSEREGIPAELLGELDLCVEIEQKGETRSLNVQTAAAVVCYEWNRQWGH